MAGYTRVDTGNNIADGNVISAADLDNEFDGIQAAFNANTGHNHDGTTGEGAPILVLGPTQDVVVGASTVTPKTTNTVDIGSSSLKFKDLYMAGNASIGGTLAVTGVATLTAQPILSSLTASRAVFTDGSKGLVSNAITGTGNVVMSASPTLTGTITAEALTTSSTVTLNGGTANGVAYLNGSKVLTTGSALTFDGAALRVSGSIGTGGAIFTNNEGGIFLNGFASYGSGLFSDATGQQIRFQAAGSEQMRLTSTGLGIGTSSPSYKLDVDGGLARFTRSSKYLLVNPNYNAANTNVDFETNTGMAFTFTQGTSERMRLDSSGNLGLGVTPSAWKSGAKAFQLGATGYASLNEQANGSTSLNFNCYESAANTWTYYVTGVAPTRYTQLSGTHAWFTAPSGTAGNAISFTQAMTLDASGNLLVGTTSNTNFAKVFALATSSGPAFACQGYSGDTATPAALFGKFSSTTTTSQVFVRFTTNNNTAGSGQINADGAGGAAFGAFSDARLKENIADLSPQLGNICALRPVEFDYIQSEGGGHQTGFIAQEMQAVYPDAVGERAPDGMLTITGWSKTDARLVKAIQEQQAIIEDMKNRLAALEFN